MAGQMPKPGTPPTLAHLAQRIKALKRIKRLEFDNGNALARGLVGGILRMKAEYWSTDKLFVKQNKGRAYPCRVVGYVPANENATAQWWFADHHGGPIAFWPLDSNGIKAYVDGAPQSKAVTRAAVASGKRARSKSKSPQTTPERDRRRVTKKSRRGLRNTPQPKLGSESI